MMLLCSLMLSVLLGSMSDSFLSVAQFCELPIDEERIKYVAHRNLGIIQTEGNYVFLEQVNVIKTHLTCLAARGINQYSSASLVTELLVTHRTWEPNSTRVYQFQMSCVKGKWGIPTDQSTFDLGDEEQPFEIPLEKQCHGCFEHARLYRESYYDRRSNCLHCHSECKAKGTGFCTGISERDCCSYINNETKLCTSDCAKVNPNFVPDANFICVCSLNCSAGYAVDTNCTECVLVDGCEAAGQPCQNGGVCKHDPSSPSRYSCTCDSRFSGRNCTELSQSGLASDGLSTAPDALSTSLEASTSTGRSDPIAGVHSVLGEMIQQMLRDLSKMSKGMKAIRLLQWEEFKAFEQQEEEEKEFQKIKERVEDINRLATQVNLTLVKCEADLTRMNSQVQEQERVLAQRLQLLCKSREFFDSLNTWDRSRVLADVLSAKDLVPADLTEVKSMEELVDVSQKKIRRSFANIQSARTALCNAIHAESTEKPKGKVAGENLAYIKSVMSVLSTEMTDANKSISELQRYTKMWKCLFVDENYANEVTTWIGYLSNDLYSTPLENRTMVLSTYKMDEVQKTYELALGMLEKAKDLRQRLRADSKLTSFLEDELRHTYSAFIEAYSFFTTEY